MYNFKYPSHIQNAQLISINIIKRSWLNNWPLGWPSSESAGDADGMSLQPLLSPDKSQKIKGLSASGMVVSVKDGRVLSRHLDLKQTFSTGYSNAKNTNTSVTWLKPAANMKFEQFAFHLGFQL